MQACMKCHTPFLGKELLHGDSSSTAQTRLVLPLKGVHLTRASLKQVAAACQRRLPDKMLQEQGRPSLRIELPAAISAAFALLSGPALAQVQEIVTDCPELLPAQEALGGATVDETIILANVALLVALIGAGVGGYAARQRKREVEKLNTQLRQINLQLRRQARMESYAPRLSYAPVAVSTGAVAEKEVTKTGNGSLRTEMVARLKAGKKCLREGNPGGALAEFDKALAMTRQLKDNTEEKKAARGLGKDLRRPTLDLIEDTETHPTWLKLRPSLAGAACQRMGRYRDAINYHSIVLHCSEQTGERSGDTEAYGAIADCYTELGELDKAGKYYDMYISRLEKADDAE